VGLLVAAAAEAHGGPAVVVAPSGRVLPFGQCLDRIAAVEAGAVDQNQLAATRSDRLVGFQSHLAASLTAPSPRRSGDPRRGPRSALSRPPVSPRGRAP